jgi:dTDP-4-dehydrorhamnose reductase
VRVLVTGGDGQLGRALAGSSPPGVELTTLARKELDIADPDAVEETVTRVGPDIIVNAAAYTAVDRAESEPELARKVNTQGPEYLAKSARTCGSRLIHVSTDFVFDGRSSSPYRPQDATAPLGVYGLTKRDGELAVLENLPERSVVLRTAWVYAAEGRNFVRTMLRLMQTNGSVRVVCDQVGTPTAAADLAGIIWKIVREPALTGIHHWTSSGVASWYDFAVAIAEEGHRLGLLPSQATVIPIATVDYPTPARRPACSLLDKSSLLFLGIPPHWRTSLKTVLGQMPHG